MVKDFTQSVMEGWITTRNKKGGGGNYRNKFPWGPGRNNLRLLPFEHKVNAFDLKREGLYAIKGLTEADIGTTVKLLVVPATRFFWRGEKARMVNGLGTRDCPLLKAFFESRENKTEFPKPTEVFVANVMCMDRPELGVLQVAFKRSEWLGPQDNKRTKVGYGIWDIVAGYNPNVKETESEDGEETIGTGGATALDPIEGRGDKVYGFKAQDIVIIKTMGNVGGKPALLMDTDVDGGPLRIRSAAQSLTVDEGRYGQGKKEGVVDLLCLPELFPGYASDGDHLTEDAYEFTQMFSNERNRKHFSSGGGTPPQDEEEDEVVGSGKPTNFEQMEEQIAAAEESEDEETEAAEEEAPVKEEPQPKSSGRKKKADLAPGDRVQFKNGGTAYIGTLLPQEDGESLKDDEDNCWVEMEADEQPSDKAKQDVTELLEECDYAVVPWKSIRVL